MAIVLDSPKLRFTAEMQVGGVESQLEQGVCVQCACLEACTQTGRQPGSSSMGWAAWAASRVGGASGSMTPTTAAVPECVVRFRSMRFTSSQKKKSHLEVARSDTAVQAKSGDESREIDGSLDGLKVLCDVMYKRHCILALTHGARVRAARHGTWDRLGQTRDRLGQTRTGLGRSNH